MARLTDFMLNRGQEDESVVASQAFSLTKVMAVVAPLLTGLATWATDALTTVQFTPTHYTVIIVSLIAFLAITGSADVLARGLATYAERQAQGRMHMVHLSKPLSAQLIHNAKNPNDDEVVTVAGVADSVPPEFLCVHRDKTITWEKEPALTFTTGQ